MDNGHHAGIWLSEFAEPYEALKANGYEITVASPNGTDSPIDKNSLGEEGIPSGWKEIADQLTKTVPLADVNSNNYSGIFLPGGHGTMFDFPDDENLKRLLQEFAEADKVIGAVCHGPAGLVNAELKDGTPLVQGKTVTSFTDSEERGVELEDQVPFMLETKLKERGASFVVADDWAEHVQTDGKLVTGQNPQSSIRVAEEFMKAL
ncbi:LOW QUALITY PROTEIN: ThiJ/PfpI family protein [Geomicrobium sp. JCM 19039]|nr:LOW QUALITY PROTEIN: ThiJ/PfpI family protein [Geomicrobium sp. JCM 19039]